MKKIFFFVCCMFLWSCITEYHAIIEESPNEILVVEGFITNDTTYIVLSKTVPLDVYAGESVYVNNASLYVECGNGTQSSASQYLGNGKYRIYTGALHTGQKYRLRILTDKDEYQSEFLAPVFTPEIDSIFWIKEGSKQPVSICVSTHDSLNQSPYYFWSYEEDLLPSMQQRPTLMARFLQMETNMFLTPGVVITIGLSRLLYLMPITPMIDIIVGNRIIQKTYCWDRPKN